MILGLEKYPIYYNPDPDITRPKLKTESRVVVIVESLQSIEFQVCIQCFTVHKH